MMEKEMKNENKTSKLAIVSFILSLVPIFLIIFYGVIRNFLFNSQLVFLLWYNLIVEVIPFVSLLLAIISIILIRRRKLKGLGFAISAFVLSIIEAILFLTIIMNVMK
jgi:hypothetical protein